MIVERPKFTNHTALSKLLGLSGIFGVNSKDKERVRVTTNPKELYESNTEVNHYCRSNVFNKR